MAATIKGALAHGAQRVGIAALSCALLACAPVVLAFTALTARAVEDEWDAMPATPAPALASSVAGSTR